MNRKQRRARGVKNTDPTIVLKRSEMKQYFDNLIQTDPLVQETIMQEVKRVNLEEVKRQSEDIDTVILMTLHSEFGFGKKRLLRFVKGLAEIHKYFENRYEDCDIIGMKMYLEERLGLNVAELKEEVERYATEKGATEG